jgi:hypothetical protein
MSGQALGRSWRLEPRDDQVIDAAWVSNRQAIEHFVAAVPEHFAGDRADASGLRL